MLVLLALVLAVLVAGGVWLYTPDLPRGTLEARYLSSAADLRWVAGVRLHVRVSGPEDAPAVVLLHGFGSSLHTWEPWAELLAATHRVIRFDLPGFGLTGPDPTGDYSDGRSVAVLAALLDQLGVGRASIVGNSLGGKIAWHFAVRHPARTDRLVLISPDGFASPGFEYGKRTSVPPVMRLLPHVLPEPLLRMSLAPAYANPATLTDATVTRYRDLMRAPGVRQAILARTEQVMLQDPEPLLRRIEAPTLLLWGEKDAMIPFRNAADYLRIMPHATLAALPGLGHVPFEEAPSSSFEPVRAFLAAGRR